MLDVQDMHAYYGKSHILQGVNLRVNKGEIVALLGRNGVGRSTTCKAIMGEVPPKASSGLTVKISPANPLLKSPILASDMCRKIAIFFQD